LFTPLQETRRRVSSAAKSPISDEMRQAIKANQKEREMRMIDDEQLHDVGRMLKNKIQKFNFYNDFDDVLE